MKNLSDLLNKESELLEEIHNQKATTQRTKLELDAVSKQVVELREQQDYGSFKFVHANLPLIMQKIAPKHKTPPPREISLAPSSSGTDIELKTVIPWVDEKCSDENPCNINVCPRCTLIHFKKVMDKLLAEYYTK